MNPESEFARTIVRHLDLGTGEIRPGTLYRLKQARAAALANLAATSTVPELATAGIPGVPGERANPRAAAVRWLAVALFVAAAGLGYQQWHAVQQVYEFEDLDLHLLASDLPIDAYLDRGFQNWLHGGSE
ncbi:MAG TPA: DUF3619 family protein [Casimicrobiaceae bacterium]|jgi:hypothetical protein|nr:DUF3619 family protein [Casimicrobiaceae bacterium]